MPKRKNNVLTYHLIEGWSYNRRSLLSKKITAHSLCVKYRIRVTDCLVTHLDASERERQVNLQEAAQMGLLEIAPRSTAETAVFNPHENPDKLLLLAFRYCDDVFWTMETFPYWNAMMARVSSVVETSPLPTTDLLHEMFPNDLRISRERYRAQGLRQVKGQLAQLGLNESRSASAFDEFPAFQVLFRAFPLKPPT